MSEELQLVLALLGATSPAWWAALSLLWKKPPPEKDERAKPLLDRPRAAPDLSSALTGSAPDSALAKPNLLMQQLQQQQDAGRLFHGSGLYGSSYLMQQLQQQQDAGRLFHGSGLYGSSYHHSTYPSSHPQAGNDPIRQLFGGVWL